MRFSNEQLASCAEREVRQRRQVFPRLVASQRMSQAFADEQIAMMEQIAREYRAKADAETSKNDLFGGAA